jgi:hypothetical protein
MRAWHEPRYSSAKPAVPPSALPQSDATEPSMSSQAHLDGRGTDPQTRGLSLGTAHQALKGWISDRPERDHGDHRSLRVGSRPPPVLNRMNDLFHPSATTGRSSSTE